jgi:hypothetical protein
MQPADLARQKSLLERVAAIAGLIRGSSACNGATKSLKSAARRVDHRSTCAASDRCHATLDPATI